MEVTELEKAINELITKAANANGCVWIVDKKQNNFAIRLSAPVTLKAYMPSNNENMED